VSLFMPGDSPPWTSNPTAYACLNWKENRGWTWDTLISHRMNLAACSSIVLRQKTYSLLPSGASIQIRGSTNGGASWTYVVGDHRTTEASLPWRSSAVTLAATGQRQVEPNTMGIAAPSEARPKTESRIHKTRRTE
jgi:hypothetical protein